MTTISQTDITSKLHKLGLPAGANVLVHSSLSSFGQVEGGADAVIDALLDAIGPDGTLLVPTLTGTALHSAGRPPVFDPLHSPTWTGLIPETLRKRPAAVRSIHPTHSVAAIGPAAHDLTCDHINSLTPCDALSPYGKLANLDTGYVLLLGVNHEANTLFHAVEEAVGVAYHMQPGLARCTLVIDTEKQYRHYMLHSWMTTRRFMVMDPIFTERGIQTTLHIGTAKARLVNARAMFSLIQQALRADPQLLCV